MEFNINYVFITFSCYYFNTWLGSMYVFEWNIVGASELL